MIIYDTEVFVKDWLFIAWDLTTKKFTTIKNDKNAFKKFYDNHKFSIWAGYNSKNYDQYIVKALLTTHDPYIVSQYIVKGEQGFNYSDDFRNVVLYTYDIYNNLNHSLKFYEGSLGDSIEETSISFDIDRKLTDAELLEVEKYCRHDVEETVKVFFETLPDFEAQLGLVKLSRPQYLSKTQTQMSAVILKAEKRDVVYDEFNIDLPETLKLNKYKYIADWYMDSQNKNYDKSLETTVAGIKHSFAWGGLHGALEHCKIEGNLLVMDVASLYPSLMIRYNLLSRAVRKAEIYKELRDKRLVYKKEHNPLQLPLKLVLNKTYGAMKDKNNPLYDPRQANRVCVYGQLLLLDLIEKLEPYIELIQTNTDGLFIKYSDDNLQTIKDITTEWQGRTGLTLEFTNAKSLWQKDVNNYVLKLSDDTLKTKGAYVKKLSPLDYADFPIINKAIIEFLVNNVAIEETINNCESLIDFQMVCKITGKFDAIFYGDKQLNEKCVRIFAGDSSLPNITKRHVETKVLHKISNTPDHVFIDNTDIHNKVVPAYLNRQFYIDLAKKRCKEFYEE